MVIVLAAGSSKPREGPQSAVHGHKIQALGKNVLEFSNCLEFLERGFQQRGSKMGTLARLPFSRSHARTR